MDKANSPLVSLVIPSFNSASLIDSCLNSILSTTYPNYEIIITDDCSTDGSYQTLLHYAQKVPNIKVIQNLTNSGPSLTRNNSIKHAQGKYISFLETDMEVKPDWLEPLVKKMEYNLQLGAVQSKVLDLRHRDIISADGLYYDPHTFWVVSENCAKPTTSSIQEKFISIGAVGSLVRKSVLDQIGAFDQIIVHNIDDIDLGWRIWLAGYSILLIPTSITYHWTAKPMDIRDKITPSVNSEIHFQKTLRIFLKNYEWGNVIRYTPWLYAIFLARVISNLLHGNTAPLQGFIKATIWNFQVLSDTLKERKRIQSLRKISDRELFAKICLPGNFFSIYKNRILPVLRRSQKIFLS